VLGVRAGAGSDHLAAQSTAAQAEIVGSLGGTDDAGAAWGKTGPSFQHFAFGGARATRTAHKGAVVERVRFVAVCYSAEACDLVGVRTGTGSDHQAENCSTRQAELVGSLDGTGGAGDAEGKTGPSF
jgi:hypothetical protein